MLIGAVSIFVYTRAVAALGPAETALFTAAVPCVTTLAAIPLLSEVPSGVALAGVGVVTARMLVALRPPSGEK
jgi:drug/metabolite transporter (DMT)-like permease